MDRISNYRQFSLVIGVSPHAFIGSVFARNVVAGRQTDRFLARQIVVPLHEIDSLADMVDVFEAALQRLRDAEFAPPR